MSQALWYVSSLQNVNQNVIYKSEISHSEILNVGFILHIIKDI